MFKRNAKNNVWIFKPLNKLANIMALLPPSSIDNSLMTLRYKCYSATIFLIIMFSSAFSLYGRFKRLYAKSNAESGIAIEVLVTIVITGLACMAIFRSGFINIQKYTRIDKLFAKIDKELNCNGNQCKNGRSLYLVPLVVHFLMFCLMLSDIFLFIKSNQLLSFTWYIIVEVILYYLNIIAVLIHSYAMNLKTRLQFANISFSAILQRELIDTHIVNQVGVVVEKWKEVCKMRRIFNTANHLIAIFNNIFGWEILLIVITIGLGMLACVNFVIVDINGKQLYEGQSWYKEEVIYYAILYVFIITVMGVVVTVTCDMTTREVEHTAMICYDLLLDVTADSKNNQDRILREELMLLAQQATHRCLHFSAAGFFKVDCTVLFGLLGTVTSYIIILLQINK